MILRVYLIVITKLTDICDDIYTIREEMRDSGRTSGWSVQKADENAGEDELGEMLL